MTQQSNLLFADVLILHQRPFTFEYSPTKFTFRVEFSVKLLTLRENVSYYRHEKDEMEFKRTKCFSRVFRCFVEFLSGIKTKLVESLKFLKQNILLAEIFQSDKLKNKTNKLLMFFFQMFRLLRKK